MPSVTGRVTCLFALLVPLACHGGTPNSTAQMARRLNQIYRDALADPVPYLHMNQRRVELWRRDLAGAPTVRPNVRYAFAYELLSAGDLDGAIRETALLLRPARGQVAPAANRRAVLDLLGVAYLRKVERRLVGWQQAAREAASGYEQVLSYAPQDLETRWMLNALYLVRGGYPDSVPERWLIPGLSRAATPSLPHFRDVAPAAGVAVDGMAGGVDLEDFNGDGWIDIFTTAYGLNDQAHLFLADGHGGFVDRTSEAGLTGIVSGLNTIHADYDNDGHPDILVLRGAWLGEHGAHPNSLLHNNGDGTFTDVTDAAGLLSLHPTQTAAWADFNNDGYLDLFIGNEAGGQFAGMGSSAQPVDTGTLRQSHPSELFLNNRDGTFTDVASAVGIAVEAFVKGVAWGDVNNDGLSDLYVSILGAPNRLYINHGGTDIANWRFEEAAVQAGVQAPQFSFACWFWDFDNDGWQDLFVASYDLTTRSVPADVARDFLGMGTEGEPARLYRNNGDGTFTDVSGDVGLDRAFYAMGANYGDINNDGYLDIYLGTGAPDPKAIIPNRMFLSRAGKRFDDVTFDGGFGDLHKGHAIAFADVDRDGDQDVYAVMGGAVEGEAAPNVLFDNPNPAPENAWVVLTLQGTTANRSAIGARIRLTVEDRDGTQREIYGTVSTGGSFGASSLQQEIGLGRTTRIRQIRVTWPDRQQTVSVLSDLAVNRYYGLVEGDSVVTVSPTPRTGP